MSFVVEVPCLFTKPTQIPFRLGNTGFIGEETIHGGWMVNQSITLNGSGTEAAERVYDSFDVSGDLVVGGNIVTSRFRNVVVNTTNVFQSTNSSSSVTLATLILNGGTLCFNFQCSGFCNSLLVARFTFELINSENIAIRSTNASFKFSHTSVHQYWGRNDVYSGVPAGTYTLRVTRNSTALRHDQNDIFNVTLTEYPFNA
jgi:hypothetical protein